MAASAASMFRDRRPARWFVEPEDHLASMVFGAAREVDDATIDRQQAVLEAYCLYGDRTSFPEQCYETLPLEDGVSHNVFASAVDALVAEVTQTRPRPLAQTIGGSYEERKTAEKLTLHWDAKFDDESVRAIMPQVARDAILSGLGIVRPYVDSEWERVRFERIFPLNLLVDDRSCVDTMPRSCYLRRFVDRSWLSEVYPEHAEKIEGLGKPDARYWLYEEVSAEVVEIIEAWHLPSIPVDEEEIEEETGDEEGPKSERGPASGRGRKLNTDGRHVIVTEDCVLLDEPYTRDYFPFAFMHAVAPTKGFWGDRMGDRAVRGQEALNRLLRRVDECHNLMGVPRVFYERGSIDPAEFDNEIGVLIGYVGNKPPTFLTPPSASAEMYRMIDMYEKWIYKEMGVSEAAATSQIQSNVESGKMLSLQNDLQSRRFIFFERSYEEAHVRLAELDVECETELNEIMDGKHEVVYEHGSQRDRIPWGDINLEKQSYRIRVAPTSALPATPMGRMNALMQMAEQGAIPPNTIFEVANDPDFEAVRKRNAGPAPLLEKILDDIIETGRVKVVPDIYMDLDATITAAKLKLIECMVDEVPDSRLDVLRGWISQCVSTKKRADQGIAQAQPPAPMPGMPMGGPMAGAPMDPMAMPPPGPAGPMPPDMMMPPPGAMPGGPPPMPMMAGAAQPL